MERVQFFFDESGKSDLSSSDNSGQPHLIIAGILVSWDSDFWDEVQEAWEYSAELLSTESAMIELHGWELYGNKGLWRKTPNALPILDIIFSALKKHNIPVYWAGLPVELTGTIQSKPWERILVAYLDFLNKKFSTFSFKNPIEVYGDENSWVKAKNALTMDNWLMFENKQVGFLNSAEVHGIQIADIVAHTLYRCNKSKLSNTDRTADDFRSKIASQIIYLNEDNA